MTWQRMNGPKVKIAGLLIALLLVILFTAMSLQTTVRDMDQTVVSLYDDRLRPAIELAQINESLQAKRRLVEDQLAAPSPGSPGKLAGELQRHDEQINERIGRYEKTKLTSNELRWLRAFKKKWLEGQALDQAIQEHLLADQPLLARQVFYRQGTLVFKHSVQALRVLTHSQLEAGQQSVEEAHRTAAGGSISTVLVKALVLVIGLLTIGLLPTLPATRTSDHSLFDVPNRT